MKRRHEEDAPCSISLLPHDVWCRIVAQSGVQHPGAVCRAWHRQYVACDWFGQLRETAHSLLRHPLPMTGSGVSLETRHTVTVAEYLDEVEHRFTYQHRLCGLRHTLSYFMLYAMADFAASGNTALLQCALYYLRDVQEKPLAAQHFHPRDFRINFFEEGHTYLLALRIDQKWRLATNIASPLAELMSRELTSTTAMLDELFEPFDEDAVAQSLAVTNRGAYANKTVAQIKHQWEEARRLGTAWHFNLECHCNGLAYETDSTEWLRYTEFARQSVRRRLVPYRTEWLIYDERLRQTGSIDILFQEVECAQRDATGRLRLVMADWKRANQLMKENPWRYGCAPCTMDMQDCKISHYRIQLLNYTHPLERHYGVAVTRRHIVGMHPAKDCHDCYTVEWEPQRVQGLIAHREQWLEAREKARAPNVPAQITEEDGGDKT